MAANDADARDDIRVLTACEAMRKRPGMYVGDTSDPRSMHELLWHLVDLVLHSAHRDVRVEITGQRASVEHVGLDVTAEQLERALTQHHGGVPFTTPSAGMFFHWPDPSVTCALSRELEATVWRDGRTFVQRYRHGRARGPVAAGARTDRHGIRVVFSPDFTIFPRRRWRVAAIDTRCRDLAALLPGLAIACNDTTYRYDGLAARIRSRFEPCSVRATTDGVRVDAAIGWSETPTIASFVNFRRTDDGGPHVAGMLAAIEAVLAPRLRARGLRKRLARGLAAAVHVVIDSPRYPTQARTTITNAEVAPVVRALVERDFARHLDATPALLDTILLDAG